MSFLQRNKTGKIIVLYDEDERLSTNAATIFVEREVENVFLLSGGLSVAFISEQHMLLVKFGSSFNFHSLRFLPLSSSPFEVV